MKFKSNGTTAKRTLKQIQKTQGTKEKQFFLFSLGVLHGFSMESNGGCKKNNNNMIRLVPARIVSGRGK